MEFDYPYAIYVPYTHSLNVNMNIEHSIISFVKLGHFVRYQPTFNISQHICWCGPFQMSLFNLILFQHNFLVLDARCSKCEMIFLALNTHCLPNGLFSSIFFVALCGCALPCIAYTKTDAVVLLFGIVVVVTYVNTFCFRYPIYMYNTRFILNPDDL